MSILTAAEIDEVLSLWDEAKKKIHELELTEKKYKEMIHGVLDATGGDVIRGSDLQVTRRIQKRRIISRAGIPAEVFDRWAKTIEVPCLTLRNLKGRRGRRSRSLSEE